MRNKKDNNQNASNIYIQVNTNDRKFINPYKKNEIE